MQKQNVMIRELTIENVGTIERYHQKFTEGIQRICYEDRRLIQAILKLVLGDCHACDFDKPQA